MIIIHSKKLVTLLSFGNANAMALFPFILLSSKQTEKFVLNHERIHLRQQLELLILPFYIWYGLEFCFYWLKYKKRDLAYMNISFEREAYTNHLNFTYLDSRTFLNHLKYLKPTKEQGSE